jgi:Cu/Ag efflux protein CusF
MTRPRLTTPLLVALIAVLAPLASAQHTTHDHGSAPASPAAAGSAPTTTPPASTLPWVNAEVRRIDAAAGKISLKHGDIPNLDMPPMTMVFQVRDPASLAGLKVGDPVRFTAEQLQGAYTVLSIEKRP